MWKKFTHHKLAMVSGVILIVMYIVVLFVEFIAPNSPVKNDPRYIHMPPQQIRFWDEQGFSLRPFVFDTEKYSDPVTLQWLYREKRDQRLYLKFLVRGEPYKLWNLFPSDLHLFGVEGKDTIYLFGTDNLGRDLFSRIIYASRISMTIGLVGVFISFILGIVLGGISGFFGGIVDKLIQRIVEILRSFPKIPLWMALGAALPSDWPPIKTYFFITIILSITGWTDLSRVVRGKILSLKNEDFVMAARLSGSSETKILFHHLVPSFTSHLIASITLSIPGMILAETSLSFLGLGIRPPSISWGSLLQAAQNIHTVAAAPWLMIPSIFVIVFVLAFNFLGDGLRNAADPY